jgi:hypothetical protein
MLNWIIKRRLAAFTRRYGYDTSYMVELLEIDRGAFFAFARAAGLSGWKKGIPKDVYWPAKLVSMVAEDCGPCTQLTVGMAIEDGADPKALAAALSGDEAGLTADQKLAIAFVRASRDHDMAAEELREQVVAKWGKKAVVSLGFAIIATKLFPTLKYAMGHGQACSRVTVDGKVIVPRGKSVEVGAIAIGASGGAPPSPARA